MGFIYIFLFFKCPAFFSLLRIVNKDSKQRENREKYVEERKDQNSVFSYLKLNLEFKIYEQNGRRPEGEDCDENLAI